MSWAIKDSEGRLSVWKKLSDLPRSKDVGLLYRDYKKGGKTRDLEGSEVNLPPLTCSRTGLHERPTKLSFLANIGPGLLALQ